MSAPPDGWLGGDGCDDTIIAGGTETRLVRKDLSFALRAKRTFGADSLPCRVCGGRLELRALARTHEVSAKLLGVLGKPWQAEQLEFRPPAYRLEEDWPGW